MADQRNKGSKDSSNGLYVDSEFPFGFGNMINTEHVSGEILLNEKDILYGSKDKDSGFIAVGGEKSSLFNAPTSLGNFETVYTVPIYDIRQSRRQSLTPGFGVIYEEEELPYETKIEKLIKGYHHKTIKRMEKIVADSTTQIETVVDESRAEIIDQGDEISVKLDELVNENESLRKLLSEKYPARTLLIFCSSSSLALIASIVAWLEFDVKVIHPILASLALTGTLGFSLLAIWRAK